MITKNGSISMNKCNQMGFTLVELIIVMAILAVLAGITIPKFGSVLSSSKNKAHTANLKMLQDAVDLYISDAGVVTTTVDNLDDLITGGYLKAVPVSPLPGGGVYTVTDGVVGGGT
jgi:prepilin-type N-terminal cleavage/methylation domain-containing protein